jgi:hypothetical protein
MQRATQTGTKIAKYAQETLMVRSHGDGDGGGPDDNE